jgi:hypothetical protein
MTITSRPRRSKFRGDRKIVYDMEWIPGTYRLTLIGVFDGVRHREYLTVGEFIDCEMTSKNRGVSFYAHFGGLSDAQFIISEIVKRNQKGDRAKVELRIAFSGSSAITITVIQGKNNWRFCDSGWLFKSPLAEIGESLGIPKLNDWKCPDHPSCGHKDKHCVFYSPLPVLTAYNRQDNLILYEALMNFAREMADFGVNMSSTIASTGMKLFLTEFFEPAKDKIRIEVLDKSWAEARSSAGDDYKYSPGVEREFEEWTKFRKVWNGGDSQKNAFKYFEEGLRVVTEELKREGVLISVFERSGDEIETSPALNKWAKESYYSSRVENLVREGGASSYYDINSSFATSMRDPLPASMSGISKRWGGSDCDLVYARVRVPEDTYLPPLPVRTGGRVVFPTGEWDGWYTGQDLHALTENGGQIMKVDKCVNFHRFTDLSRYVDEIYSRRLKAASSGDAFRALLYKYLLNCLYGKFAESEEKEMVLVCPDRTPEIGEEIDGAIVQYVKKKAPGIIAVGIKTRVEHRHVIISSVITARSRLLLLRGAKQVTPHYMDTDSVSTPLGRPMPASMVGGALGQWKHEYDFESGLYICPKVYLHRGTTKKDKAGNPVTVVKAKGFPRLSESDLEDLRNGGTYLYERMIRARGLLTLGGEPRDLPSKKTLKLLFEKRVFSPDGSSRPYRIADLPIDRAE